MIQSDEFAKAASSSKGSEHSSVINSCNLTSDASNFVPDEQSPADEALLESSSLCSLGASNNRNICSRKHDDIDDSVQNNEEIVKKKAAREGTGVKRSRNAEVHNLCERVRDIHIGDVMTRNSLRNYELGDYYTLQ